METLLPLPEIHAQFETVDPRPWGATGSTSAVIKRLEHNDDGSVTVVIDHWPSSNPPLVNLQDRIDAARYRWLRDSYNHTNPQSKRKTNRRFDAPLVIAKDRHAVLRGSELDAAIDQDMLDDMSQFIYEEMFVEGDARFSDPTFQFSDELSDECTEKAKVILAAQLDRT